MKTPFTSPEAPADLRRRWLEVEALIGQGPAEKARALCRHIALGCSLCKQEEVLAELTGARHFLTEIVWRDGRPMPGWREALVLLDLVMLEYLRSEEGKEETAKLRAGLTPLFGHDENGPAPGVSWA